MTFVEKRRKMLAEALKLGIDARDRQTGKSTGQALQTIGTAMLFPGEEICVDDHFGTHNANKNQFEIARRIVNTLGLEGFRFHTARLTINYDLERE